MNIILIFLKIIATGAVLYLAKDSSLLPLRCVDDDVIPKWRIEFIKILLLTIIAILMIWIK